MLVSTPLNQQRGLFAKRLRRSNGVEGRITDQSVIVSMYLPVVFEIIFERVLKGMVKGGVGLLALLVLLLGPPPPVWAGLGSLRLGATSSTAPIRPNTPCPADLEPLVAQLLNDLPTYSNLVASRSLSHPEERSSPFGTVLVAGRPDFTPLPLGAAAPEENLHQVFFTTLERQYWQQQAVSLQHYHWLFLAQGDDGWRLSLIYSSVGTYPAGSRGATPPQESSQGLVGQAIALWLRDCRAGAIAFPEADPMGP